MRQEGGVGAPSLGGWPGYPPTLPIPPHCPHTTVFWLHSLPEAPLSPGQLRDEMPSFSTPAREEARRPGPWLGLGWGRTPTIGAEDRAVTPPCSPASSRGHPKLTPAGACPAQPSTGPPTAHPHVAAEPTSLPAGLPGRQGEEVGTSPVPLVPEVAGPLAARALLLVRRQAPRCQAGNLTFAAAGRRPPWSTWQRRPPA